MMGLLDGIFGGDPQDVAMMAYGLMSGRGNLGQNLGQAGMQMLQQQEQRKLRAQQDEMRQLQMDQIRKQIADAQRLEETQGKLGMAAQQAFRPPQALDPRQQEGGQEFAPGGGGVQGYARQAMEIDPRNALQYAQMMQKQAPQLDRVNPKDFDPASLAAFQRSGDYSALKPIQKQSDKMAELNALMDSAGITDPAQRQKVVAQYVQKTSTHQPAVQVNTKLEGAESGAKGKYNIEQIYQPSQQASQVASRENSILTAMEKNPVDTSRAAPLTSTAAAWLSAAGLGGDKLKQVASNAQMFQGAAMELVLQKQLAQKGPQTESDARRLEQTVASLGNTKEANAAIIKFSKAQNNYVIDQGKFYRDWWSKNKTMEGAEQAWYSGPGARSVWDDPGLKGYGQSKSPASNAGWEYQGVVNGNGNAPN